MSTGSHLQVEHENCLAASSSKQPDIAQGEHGEVDPEAVCGSSLVGEASAPPGPTFELSTGEPCGAGGATCVGVLPSLPTRGTHPTLNWPAVKGGGTP